MDAAEAIKTILFVLAALIAAPVIALIVRVSVFFGGLKRAVEGLEKVGTEFTHMVTARLNDHSEDISDHQTRIAVLEHTTGVVRIEREGSGRRAGDGHEG